MQRRATVAKPVLWESLEPRQLLAQGQGLLGHHFADPHLRELASTFSQPFMDINWGTSSPHPGQVPVDHFSSRFSGQIQPLVTETHTFHVTADDGVRLWINGRLLIDQWQNRSSPATHTATFPMRAGRYYDILIEYYDNTGNAAFKLEWSAPGLGRQVIPANRLFPSDRGRLLHEIWNNVPGAQVSDLTSLPTYPHAPTSAFHQSNLAIPSLGNQYGQRLSGLLHAPQTGNYRFLLSAEDSAELWVSNSDDPANQRRIAAVGATTPQATATVRLVAGQSYSIEAIHKEDAGTDHLRVGWTLPDGTTHDAIPGHYLSPPATVVQLITDEHTASESSTNPLIYTVRRSGPISTPLHVFYSFGGSATNGQDYQQLNPGIIIPAGQRTAQVRVVPINDTLSEGGRETFTVQLLDGTNYTLAADALITGTGSIGDDENIPTSTTNVLPADTPSHFFSTGTGTYGTRTNVSVTGMPFTQAMQVSTTNNPPNVYSIQLVGRNSAAIVEGDTLFATFYARATGPTGTASMQVVFERNGTPFDKAVTFNATVGTEWTQIQIPFAAHDDFAANAAQFNFQLGYNNQTIQIGGVSLVNFGTSISPNDLPRTSLSYNGRKSSDSWRADAEQRIEAERKKPFTVTVRDVLGNPIEGAVVNVTQVKHAFGFGSAVAADGIFNTHPVNGPNYQNLIKEVFNRVVLENDLKWPNWQGNPTKAINAIQWLLSNGVSEIRGHNLIWPAWRWMPASPGSTYNGINYRLDPDKPDSQEEYEAHVAADGVTAANDWLRDRVRTHITQEASAAGVKGNLIDWDVINEPFSEHDVQDLLGTLEMVEWFKLAKAADPDAALYLNDYPNPAGGGHLDAFYNTIQFLLDNGAPLEGIGIQGHFGTNGVSIPATLATYDRFSAFGLPIQITEFDIDTLDEQLQADFLRDFMMASFSHDSLDGFMMWGFWQGRHWRPNAALYRNDWSIKPNGQMFMDLVFGQWWTDIRGTTLGNGAYTARAFEGAYDITVTIGGETKTIRASIGVGTNAIDVQMQSLVVEGGGGNDTFILKPDAGGTSLKLWKNQPETSAPTATIPLASLAGVEVRGNAGADHLAIDAGLAMPFRFDSGIEADQLTVLDGTLTLDGETVLPNPNLRITAAGDAIVRFSESRQIGALTLNDASEAELAPGGQITLRTAGLDIADTALLDLHDNELILEVAAAARDAELLRLNDLVRRGRGGGAWTGRGLSSSAARNDQSGLTGLAVVAAQEGIVVKYTWKADANADQRVDADDYFIVDRGFLRRSGLFHQGNVDYLNQVDLDDYLLLDESYLTLR